MPGGLVKWRGKRRASEKGSGASRPGENRAIVQTARSMKSGSTLSSRHPRKALMRRCLLITVPHHEICDERCSVRWSWGNKGLERPAREQRSLGSRWCPMDSLRWLPLLARSNRLGGVRSGKARGNAAGSGLSEAHLNPVHSKTPPTRLDRKKACQRAPKGS
jgi:hypothetical protein